MRVLLIFCFGLVMLDSCITPFDLELSASESQVVVDGIITDQPGPYTVKLYNSASLDRQIFTPSWYTGATVWIFDDAGNSEQLTETSEGTYQTSPSGIQGVIGRKYYVRIITKDEEAYESEPEELLPVGEIENLYHEFEQNVPAAAENFSNPKNGFSVYVDASVLPEQKGYVRWRTTQVFEFKTYPESRTKRVYRRDGSYTVVPDPFPCSGYFVRQGRLTRENDCTCCDCWTTRYEEIPLVSDEAFVKDGKITRNKIAYVPASRRLFHKKYYVKVDQLSVSKKVFDFWNNIKKQKLNGSDLFQTPPPDSKGNITALREGAKPMLGIFGASSVKTRSIFIEKEDIPYYVTPIDTLDYGCTEVYPRTTNVRPSFW